MELPKRCLSGFVSGMYRGYCQGLTARRDVGLVRCGSESRRLQGVGVRAFCCLWLRL